MAITTSAPRTARERARREITEEIKQVARAHLADGGGAALSLRAVARQMGMASSALFRYFPNRDALLTALIVDSYSSLADAAEQGAAQAADGSGMGRWLAICHGVRDWALAHPHEYGLIFGSPVPGYAAPEDTVAPALRVPRLLAGLLSDVVEEEGFDPEELPAVPPAAERALAPVLTTMPDGVPTDLALRGLMSWTYLFGAVSFEVFGHRTHSRSGTAAADDRAYFDHEMRRLAELLSLLPGS